MTYFWGASGHVLLDRDGNGHLTVTDEFLKAYLARPELAPVEEVCANERALHGKLLTRPRASVSPAEIAAIADADARENWQMFLAFRDRLLDAPSMEAAYLKMIRSGVGGIPPLFLGQMVQVILRNALDGNGDAFTVRAAELLFRAQRVTIHEGTLLLADEEIITGHEADRHASPLLAMLGGEAVTSLDILKTSNADSYWDRSDAHDIVLDLGGNPNGREALARALTIWLRHLMGLEVSITPVERIEDADWRWFAGLDQEATRLGNALWRGEDIGPETMSRVVALFALEAQDRSAFDARLGGKPVYLILAMDGQKLVRLKPQNLVTGLPLAAKA
jgi:hypothetical protein